MLIVLGWVILSSCEKNYVKVPGLVGRWDWVSTCGGFAGICYTPESTGKSSYYVFTADSNYYFYANDTLISKGRYHTYTRVAEDSKVLNMLQAGEMSAAYNISGDLLSWPSDFLCCDFMGSSYRKAK